MTGKTAVYEMFARQDLKEEYSGLSLPKLEMAEAMRLLDSRRSSLHWISSFDWITKSSPFCVSTQPFCTLKKIHLKELKINIRALNSYLLLRIVDILVLPHYDMMRMVVEDENSDLSFCEVVNYVFINRDQQKMKEFQIGTTFVIKEPWFKECIGDKFSIFVTSPSDIIRVTRNHLLFQETVSLGWNDTSKDPQTAFDWKDRGNSFFRLGNYFEAIEAYLMGLKQTENENLQLTFHLNLSATYLAAGFYESCLEHADKVLSLDPKSNKALYRAGCANYELGLYQEALKCFEKAVLEHSNKEAVDKTEHCKMRLKEQNGDIDEFELLQYSNDTPGINIDFGDYEGPVQVVNVPGKYRGLVATQDLEPGTLIVAEKAVTSETFEFKLCDSGEMVVSDVSVSQVISALHKNSKTFKKILNLSCGQKEGSLYHKIYCDEEHELEIIIDVLRIHEILKINAFGYTLRNFDKAVSLFPLSAYINHCCLCNSTLSHYNNVIIIRTGTLVRAGDEITIHYKASMEPQMTDMSFYEFSCTCKFCELERKDTNEMQERRTELVTDVLHFVSDEDYIYLESTDGQKQLECFIQEIGDTYGERKTLTTALYLPYLHLAKCLRHNSKRPAIADRVMDLGNKALECLGLSINDLLSCANSNHHFPKEAFIWNINLLVDVSYLILTVQGTPEGLKQWYDVLVMLERISSGGGLKFLKLKYPKFDKLSKYIQSLQNH